VPFGGIMASRISWDKDRRRSMTSVARSQEFTRERQKRLDKIKPLPPDLKDLFDKAASKAAGSSVYKPVLSIIRMATYRAEITPKQLAFIKAVAEGKELYLNG
jgi:hypothetical protein